MDSDTKAMRDAAYATDNGMLDEADRRKARTIARGHISTLEHNDGPLDGLTGLDYCRAVESLAAAIRDLDEVSRGPITR